MLSFKEYLERKLKDPEFKKLWDESEEEYEIERQRIRAEIEQEKQNQAAENKVAS